MLVWQDMPSIADNSTGVWGNRAYDTGTDSQVTEDGKVAAVEKVKGEKKMYLKMKELIKNNPAFAKYEGCKYTIDSQDTTFTSKAYPCRKYVHKIVNAEGDVVHYVNSYYFLASKTIYCVSYNCVDGVGYDAEFDFDAYLRTNFTFVD